MNLNISIQSPEIKNKLTYSGLVEANEECTPALVFSILSGACFVLQPAFAPVGVQYDTIAVVPSLTFMFALCMLSGGVVDTKFQGLRVALHIMVLDPFSFHRWKVKMKVKVEGSLQVEKDKAKWRVQPFLTQFERE